MLRDFFGKIGRGLIRTFSVVKEPLRKLGQTAVKYHQPISMMAAGLLGSSGNPTLQKVGAGIALGSAALTKFGIGNNYLGNSSQSPAPSPT